MAEMNRVSRFFVNRSSARRNARIYDWVRANLSLPAGAACLEIGCGNGDMAARLVDGFRPARYIATEPRPAPARGGESDPGEAISRRSPARIGAACRQHARPPIPGCILRRGLRVRRDPPREPEAPRLRECAAGPGGDQPGPQAQGVLGLRGDRTQGEDSPMAHGARYALTAVQRGWKRESVIATKIGPTS
jgi:hypothetical protein